MKISYISLRKRLEEIRKNKKEKNKKNKLENDEQEETKFIGINYSKKDAKKDMRAKKVFSNLKTAPKGSYTLVISMILLLAITTKLNMDTYKKLGQEEYKTYSLDENIEERPVGNSNVVVYKEAVSSIFDRNEDAEEAIKTSSENILDLGKDELEEEKYVYEYTFLRPIDGETLKEYSMDKVIYSKTLDMWKVHDGIDILSNVGEKVKASEKGIIERIYEDSFYGYSVIIDHQNGIKTIYRNLNSDINVKEKQEIKKGEIIGSIGDTAIGESKDEYHLHFEVVKNGEIVNPNVIGIK